MQRTQSHLRPDWAIIPHQRSCQAMAVIVSPVQRNRPLLLQRKAQKRVGDHIYVAPLVTQANVQRNVVSTFTFIPGRLNTLADALSRNKREVFQLQAPDTVDPSPTSIPHALPEVLYGTQPDWHSPTWTQQFTSFMRPA